MSNLEVHTIESAPEASRPILDKAGSQLGPLLRTIANERPLRVHLAGAKLYARVCPCTGCGCARPNRASDRHMLAGGPCLR